MTPPSDPNPQSLGPPYWAVQPRWVRALVVAVALPAWIVLAIGIFHGGLSSAVQNTAMGLFIAVGLIELVYIARAYWGLDL